MAVAPSAHLVADRTRLVHAILVAALALEAACGSAGSSPVSGRSATFDLSASPLPSATGRDAAIALVRGLDQVGRVDRIDAKLMSFAEYVRFAGPVRTYPGDPRSTPMTGFGILDDPASRYVWAVAVSGEVYPNGRVPVFFGGPPPGSPTPYPPYRWGIFLVDAGRGGMMVIGDAGIDQPWPAQFDALPSHPVAVASATRSPAP